MLPHFLASNAIPTVIGPENKYYMVDHHHFCLAVYRADIPDELKFVILNITASWSDLSHEEFWKRMLASGYFWPFDAVGTLHPALLPSTSLVCILSSFVSFGCCRAHHLPSQPSYGPLHPNYLPRDVSKCPDDPYRSLVAQVILGGAIRKSCVSS